MASESKPRGALDMVGAGFTCALFPGACAASAVDSAEVEVRAARQAATDRAQLARTEAAAQTSGFFSGVADVVEASREPIAEAASATRYQAVAAAIITLAIVAAIIVIALRTW